MTDIKPTVWEVIQALERGAVAMKGMADILRKHGNRPPTVEMLACIEKHTELLSRHGKLFGRWCRQQKVVGGNGSCRSSDS